MPEAWIQIPEPRYTQVWDRFDEAFDFRPSIHPVNWPAFREPLPSITFDIRDLLSEFDPWSDPRVTPYNLGLLNALKACVPEDEPVLALDWQHAAYEFFPHRLDEASQPDQWSIPGLPSSEYHLFVTADHRLGSLGHPWEGTVCVFGIGFVDEYLKHSPLGKDRIIRRRDS